MHKSCLLSLIIALALLGCTNDTANDGVVTGGESAANTGSAIKTGRGMMAGMGPGSGMMARHHAAIPEEYAGLSNPIAADEESLARGGEIYNLYCANCHGDGGMGDGPIAQNLDPAPAPVAHTSQMLGDDYLFWRISEGGHEFDSVMPSWEEALEPEERWDVINYVRALGSGTVMPGTMMGGARFDPEAEVAQRAEMLAEAVAANAVTQEEADLFEDIHNELDTLLGAQRNSTGPGMGMGMRGNADAMLAGMLAELTTAEVITQAEADAFLDIHDRLLAAGLME